jgi:hypothetical protein
MGWIALAVLAIVAAVAAFLWRRINSQEDADFWSARLSRISNEAAVLGIALVAAIALWQLA